MITYSKVSQELLKDISKRQKEIIVRRFGLKTGNKETLESIGKDFDITRERVRQIEEFGLAKMAPKMKDYQDVVKVFADYLKKYNGARREDLLLQDLGGKKEQAYVNFLMTLSKKFKKFKETSDTFSFWAIDEKILFLVKEIIKNSLKKFNEIGKPIAIEELEYDSVKGDNLRDFLSISKQIQANVEGLLGIKSWPSINPKGVKDKAYFVFKKENKPLHFTDVARMLKGSVVQTVHNELIKDPRFVLIGRGTYALSEWGYHPGHVKDIIKKVLVDSLTPLTKEEILEKVSSQRLVKENTIILNLNDKRFFLKNNEGKYKVREA